MTFFSFGFFQMIAIHMCLDDFSDANTVLPLLLSYFSLSLYMNSTQYNFLEGLFFNHDKKNDEN
jgi:hypothetical protein